MLQIKHLQRCKKCIIFKTYKLVMEVQNTQSPPPQRHQKYYCEWKETYLSYSLDDKAFHLPEFRAKLFFKVNWVGGFYWDSLLNLCDNVPEYTLNPLEPKNLSKIFMILNMVIAINW